MSSDGPYSDETPYFIFANENETVRDRHSVCSMGCNFVSIRDGLAIESNRMEVEL